MYEEMADADGSIRPTYKHFFNFLQSLTVNDLQTKML